MNDRAIDQELVERAQAGDRRAFDLLVLKYERKVQRLISRYIHDSGDIDDVTQETFIKAYRALGSFRGDSAFYTWLYRIAINCAKNYLASPARRIVPISEIETDSEEDTESFERSAGLQDVATPDAEYASKQIAETVNRAMAELPEDLRTAVTLREIEGLSYEEIAAAMDCPIGTVRSRIFRAREAIAARLRPLLGTREGKRW
ncbi:MAG: RNA polymerase sigma factor RpoE [Casimicrobiaceae bacterium]|nr:RNA polymerase sigma factor RpoE [Casimicrobiaceae bacterium]MCX8099086.1 RNA polymerase sigma factor RpoE [Casimicrobiaceae bacterium]MDW8312378.1 RNA polymerase sigma factor RpoE [Burkholderiales bacterium]